MIQRFFIKTLFEKYYSNNSFLRSNGSLVTFSLRTSISSYNASANNAHTGSQSKVHTPTTLFSNI